MGPGTGRSKIMGLGTCLETGMPRNMFKSMDMGPRNRQDQLQGQGTYSTQDMGPGTCISKDKGPRIGIGIKWAQNQL